MNELIETIGVPNGFDKKEYREYLMRLFRPKPKKEKLKGIGRYSGQNSPDTKAVEKSKTKREREQHNRRLQMRGTRFKGIHPKR